MHCVRLLKLNTANFGIQYLSAPNCHSNASVASRRTFVKQPPTDDGKRVVGGRDHLVLIVTLYRCTVS